jgi:restriction endonuclease
MGSLVHRHVLERPFVDRDINNSNNNKTATLLLQPRDPLTDFHESINFKKITTQSLFDIVPCCILSYGAMWDTRPENRGYSYDIITAYDHARLFSRHKGKQALEIKFYWLLLSSPSNMA